MHKSIPSQYMHISYERSLLRFQRNYFTAPHQHQAMSQHREGEQKERRCDVQQKIITTSLLMMLSLKLNMSCSQAVNTPASLIMKECGKGCVKLSRLADLLRKMKWNCLNHRAGTQLVIKHDLYRKPCPRYRPERRFPLNVVLNISS